MIGARCEYRCCGGTAIAAALRLPVVGSLYPIIARFVLLELLLGFGQTVR